MTYGLEEEGVQLDPQEQDKKPEVCYYASDRQI